MRAYHCRMRLQRRQAAVEYAAIPARPVRMNWLPAQSEWRVIFGCQPSQNECAINNGIPQEFAIKNAHVVDFAWNRELHDPSTYRVGEVVPIQN